MLYLDTSALARLYVTEPGSPPMHSLVEANRGAVFTSLVSYVEKLSVLARAAREKRLTPGRYAIEKWAFLTDWKELHIVAVSQEMLGACYEITCAFEAQNVAHALSVPRRHSCRRLCCSASAGVETSLDPAG